jgi:hypothetical protein
LSLGVGGGGIGPRGGGGGIEPRGGGRGGHLDQPATHRNRKNNSNLHMIVQLDLHQRELGSNGGPKMDDLWLASTLIWSGVPDVIS